MAYIRKRGNSWYYTIDIGKDPATGKRRQVSKGGFRTKAAAEKAAAKAVVDVTEGVFVKDGRTTFEEYADLWLKSYCLSGRKKSSIYQREYQVKTLISHLGKMPLTQITRKMYRETILNLSSRLARNTVQGIHGTAKQIFRMAMLDGDIKVDPTEYVEVPKKEEEFADLPKYMEKEQLAEFLRLAKTRGLEMDFEMFYTLSYTGMRIGELLALKWSDIDFNECTISINRTLYNPYDLADQFELLPPKTKNSKRTIDVDPSVIDVLQKLKARQNEFRMKHRKIYYDADFVFARMDTPRNRAPSYGYPLVRGTINKRMRRLMQWMNLKHSLSPHSLRHTHTTLLAEAGVSLEAIMDRLGHKDDRVTRLIYLHVTKKMKREASEKFSALMADVVKM